MYEAGVESQRNGQHWTKIPGRCFQFRGHSYILIVEEGCECKIAGSSTVRYFSLSINVEKAAEVDRAIEANKDV